MNYKSYQQFLIAKTISSGQSLFQYHHKSNSITMIKDIYSLLDLEENLNPGEENLKTWNWTSRHWLNWWEGVISSMRKPPRSSSLGRMSWFFSPALSVFMFHKPVGSCVDTPEMGPDFCGLQYQLLWTATEEHHDTHVVLGERMTLHRVINEVLKVTTSTVWCTKSY
jgi:hypothetical protein